MWRLVYRACDTARDSIRPIAAYGALLLSLSAWPQAYPTKTVQIVSAASLSSTGDIAMRLMAPKMAAGLGQQVVVETRSAAGGALAAVPVMRAAPDGYTLLYATPNILVLGRFVSKNQPFDVLKDFSPISLTIGFSLFLVANAEVPANSVTELIDYAKKNPGKLAYGSTGFGSPIHLLMESFKIVTGTDILHVPYTASGAAATVFNDLVAGRVQLYTGSFTPIKPHLPGGKIKVLTVMDHVRSKHLPQVPAVTETLPNFQAVSAYYGLLGPNGLPRPLVDRLNAEAKKALDAPDVAGKLDDLGMFIIASTPEGLLSRVRSDIEGVGKLANTLGLKPE